MKRRRGFTLIELMVVILIVALLAAVAIPILRSRIDAAKWSEGKAMMGTIATAMRAYAAEQGMGATAPTSIIGLGDDGTLGFATQDLDGTYFTNGDFALTGITMPTVASPVLLFTVTCTPGTGTAKNPPITPAIRYYVEDGNPATEPFTTTAPGS
jgi:prepilin-type N-terminal cleavage/methylation domain-containing protein